MTREEAITRIDRFLAYLEKIYTPQCDYEEALIRKDDITAFLIARDALKEQRPHGEWEFIGENLFMCTKCGYIADANYLGKWKAHTFDSNFPNFCPNCGADMREGESN